MREGRANPGLAQTAGQETAPKGRRRGARATVIVALLAYCVLSWAALFQAGKIAVAWATKDSAALAQQDAPQARRR